MTIRVADPWFERKRIGDDVTLLWEPHVERRGRCNIWHIRGRDRDLLVDSGMGICSLRGAAKDLFEKQVIVCATHTHYDHVGSMHEFDIRVVHRQEAHLLDHPDQSFSLRVADTDELASDDLAGVSLPSGKELRITAVPDSGYDPATWRTEPAEPTWIVEEGDIINLGDRAFEVLHLAGHSPGSIGLWEAKTGTLFSGDAIYNGALRDRFPESNIADYIATMRRLRTLPVTIVHGGHRPSFGRERLVEIADRFIENGGYVPDNQG